MFWPKVATFKNAGGELIMAAFDLKVYSLPISNALVERVFSQVTAVKTKVRNLMGLGLLTYILRIKIVMKEKGHLLQYISASSLHVRL